LRILNKDVFKRYIYVYILIVLGGYVTTCPLVLVELFSPAMIAKTFGLYFFAVGLSALAFTPIGGI
jgi:hypothetical protein